MFQALNATSSSGLSQGKAAVRGDVKRTRKKSANQASAHALVRGRGARASRVFRGCFLNRKEITHLCLPSLVPRVCVPLPCAWKIQIQMSLKRRACSRTMSGTERGREGGGGERKSHATSQKCISDLHNSNAAAFAATLSRSWRSLFNHFT